MPPKTKPPTRTPAAAPVLAAEVAPPAAGLDMLRPLVALSTRERATVVKAFGAAMASGRRLEDAGKTLGGLAPGDETSTDAVVAFTVAAGDALEFKADAEDALIPAAYDPDAFREWVTAAPMDVVTALFNAYGATLGEVLASPS